MRFAAAPALSDAPGNNRSFTLCVDLGGVVMELRTHDSGWIQRTQERFGSFTTNARPVILVEHRPWQDGPPVASEPLGDVFILHRSARWEHLDALLSTLVPERAAPALTFHGALLTDGVRTHLCCGLSGAGKSTLAALLPERALCDELALVRRSAEGFEGISLPFWDARPGSAPLAGVFVLEHAPEHRRRRLEAAEAIRELRRHVCWPTEKPDALAGTFASLAGLVEEVPVSRLGFRRDPGVWDVIMEPVP